MSAIAQVFLFKLHACCDLAVGLLDFPLNFVQVKVFIAQLCLTLCDPMGCNLPGSSVHGILQAKILEWIAISFSRGSSQPRDPKPRSCIAGRFFSIWATKEALVDYNKIEERKDTSIWTNVYLAGKQNEMEKFIYHVSKKGTLKVHFPFYCAQSWYSVKPWSWL